jgi:transposase InsO family protein
MKSSILQGVICGKTPRTTTSDKAALCRPDRVNREFRAPSPNRLWVSDFTYVSTSQGFVYVAFMIDILPATSSAGGSPAPLIRGSS